MKRHIHPTNVERTLKAEDFIVSKTDTRGRITYCNRVFMALSGYRENELLGSQHNIVRHPDMPRGVFHLLWQNLQQGREFFGYIKNLCKDGGYYWVFANLTPTYDSQGKRVGYYSVRRRPDAAALEIIQPLYAEMLEKEERSGPRDAIQASVALLNEKLSARKSDYEHFVLEI
ncbi:MAG: PAS domain-containing protein [Gammaproteobacteria bacterium]|nr:PAS domain-containing protein [Gammaproteobacteria bacterium]